MTIIKNEPLYPFQEANYSKPRHIIVEGTCEEIGYDLANLAKNDFNAKLGRYKDAVYAQARQEYLARNWPEMLEQAKGVLKAYGLTENDVVYDATTLPYDFYDLQQGGQLDFNTCSAVVLPWEKSNDGGIYVARNFDLMAMVLWSDLQGKKPPENAYKCWERSVVIEKRPDQGYKTILIGGQELLIPYIDGINEKGLYISLFHDPAGVGNEGGATSGGDISGISMIQLLGLLLDTCANVEEAKKTILMNRVIQVMLNAHMIIADASGNATIFEIDKKSQAYVFVDREANKPLFITNHPIHTYPTPDTYPEFDLSQEHNTFTRQILLQDKLQTLETPYQREDAITLMDTIHCAFIDDRKAEAAPKERTLINTNADLSKPEISVRFYLGDEGEIPHKNHIKTRMSDFYTFGFDN